jgi:hypothetical protein
VEPTGIEPVTGLPETTNQQGLTSKPENALAFSLAHKVQKEPDLAMVVKRWDSLPEAVRAGIVAMVKAASAG